MVLGDEGFKSGALGSEERERERESLLDGTSRVLD